MNETFTGSSAADPDLVPLGDACLTGAAPGSSPPAGASALTSCGSQTVGPVPPQGVTPGYLQLTDADYYRVGDVLFNRALPANGGIQITFDQYQYGGSNPLGTPAGGADGIGFFLVDGAAELTETGASGGSLGYAQKTDAPGVNNGYLGVGLDAYGNFSNDGEGRGTGCSTPSPFPSDSVTPDSVVARGPGDGLLGYCFLDANTSLPGSLRVDTTDPAAAERTVRITVTPNPNPVVTVEIDFNDGTGFHTVLSYALPTPLPPTFKFGLSASTGGATDVHLIRTVSVNSVVPLPEINLVKQVPITNPPQPSAYPVGSTVPYEFVVTNTSATQLVDVAVTDPAVSDLHCPDTVLGPAGSPTATMICTGTHTITDEDIEQPTFTNTATATGTDTAGHGVTATASATVPLASTPVLTKTADADVVIAGNPVGFTVSLSNPGPPSALSGLTLTDPLPATAGVSWSITGQQGPATCTITGAPPTQTLDCGTFTLDVGEHQLVHVQSQTAASTPCGTLDNTATATSPATGTTRTATASVRVDCTGSLTVTKTITGPEAGHQGPVIIRVTCDGVRLEPDFVILAGETGTHSHTYQGITAGQTCVASEIDDGSTPTVSQTEPRDDQAITIAPGPQSLGITDSYDLAPGSLTVSKLIGGPAADRQGAVTIAVVCSLAGTQTFNSTFTIPALSSAGVYRHTFTGIPANSTCTITEPAIGATSAVDVAPGALPPDVTIPPGGDETADQITDIYSFAPGSLTVTKTITGPAAGQQGPITIEVFCNGILQSPVISIPGGATSFLPQTFSPIPAGSRCWAIETVDGHTNAVDVTARGSGRRVTIPAGGNAALGITDIVAPAPPGSLAVNKIITGNAAGSQGTVAIGVICSLDGTENFTGTFTVPARSAADTYDHLFQPIPAGSSCTVTEITSGASRTVTVTVTGSPQTVDIPANGGNEVTIENDYEFAPGRLIVSKTIAGPAAGRQGEITVLTVCDGVALTPDLVVPAGAPAGTFSRTYASVPGNSTCDVTETADGSDPNVTVTISPQDGQTVLVPPRRTATAHITDTYEPVLGALEVRKLIGGQGAGDQGPVTIHVACELGGAPSFAAHFTIPARHPVPGASGTFGAIPSGSRCTVAETANGSNRTVSAVVTGSPQTVTIHPGATAVVELADIYSYRPGSLKVIKTLTGPVAGRQGKVVIHTECDGVPLRPDFVIPAGTPPGTVSKTYRNIPGNAVCMVSEGINGLTETVQVTVIISPRSDQAVTIPPGGKAIARVRDTNDPFPTPPLPVTG